MMFTEINLELHLQEMEDEVLDIYECMELELCIEVEIIMQELRNLVVL